MTNKGGHMTNNNDFDYDFEERRHKSRQTLHARRRAERQAMFRARMILLALFVLGVIAILVAVR